MPALRERLRELAAQPSRWGSRKLHWPLEQEGIHVKHKLLWLSTAPWTRRTDAASTGPTAYSSNQQARTEKWSAPHTGPLIP